jgi:hypothetical protein
MKYKQRLKVVFELLHVALNNCHLVVDGMWRVVLLLKRVFFECGITPVDCFLAWWYNNQSKRSVHSALQFFLSTHVPLYYRHWTQKIWWVQTQNDFTIDKQQSTTFFCSTGYVTS